MHHCRAREENIDFNNDHANSSFLRLRWLANLRTNALLWVIDRVVENYANEAKCLPSLFPSASTCGMYPKPVWLTSITVLPKMPTLRDVFDLFSNVLPLHILLHFEHFHFTTISHAWTPFPIHPFITARRERQGPPGRRRLRPPYSRWPHRWRWTLDHWLCLSAPLQPPIPLN